jgi:enoyl-[acyl-carrier protein] reductase I
MTETEPLMAGKRGLIMGVANDRSIAWGIASAVSAQGAELAFSYQGEALAKRVRPLAESVGSDIVLPCDVTDDASIDAVFTQIEARWSRDNFIKSLDISCYSFTAVSQRAVPLMNEGGSLLTLTYYGAERVMPHYNVMGVAKAALEASVRYLAADLGEQNIRVNAISAGPIKTLAASGIGDFRYILKWNEYNSPLHRNVDTDQVGGSALYLLSDLSSGVTGEIHHVDSGYHVVGMMSTQAAPEVAEMLRNFNPQG